MTFERNFEMTKAETGGKGTIPEGGQTSDPTIFDFDEPGSRDPATV